VKKRRTLHISSDFFETTVILEEDRVVSYEGGMAIWIRNMNERQIKAYCRNRGWNIREQQTEGRAATENPSRAQDRSQ